MKVVLERGLYERAPAQWNRATKMHGLEWCFVETQDDEKALAFHVEGVSAFVIGAGAYPRSFYEALRTGTLIQRFGVGYNAVPVDLCKERGLSVGYTPGVLETSVAEHTMALILSLSRTICVFDHEMKAGTWHQITGSELRGKTLALIGFGRIARETAKIAQNGFGMKTVAYDILLETNLDDCLKMADYVSIHLPDTPQTAGMVDAGFLARMKPTAFLVNTARGSVIDEVALFDALTKKKIAGAALDVFVQEPYEPQGGADFRSIKNVLLTPHCGSNTVEASARMAEICINNCAAFAQGKLEDMILIPEQKGSTK